MRATSGHDDEGSAAWERDGPLVPCAGGPGAAGVFGTWVPAGAGGALRGGGERIACPCVQRGSGALRKAGTAPFQGPSQLQADVHSAIPTAHNIP